MRLTNMDSVLQKFDIYAMVKPKTSEDYLALLEEAHSEADNLNTIYTELLRKLENNTK